MSCFFASTFGSKRPVSPGKKEVSASTEEKGRSSSPDKSEDTSTTKTRTVIKEDSWEMFRDSDGRPFWRNSRTGHWVYQNTTVIPSFSYFLVPPPAMSAQPPLMPGYPPYLATPSVYAAVPQPWAFVPSPTPVIVPVVPVSSLVHYKKTDKGEGKTENKSSGEMIDGEQQSGAAEKEDDAAVEGTEKPVRAKTSGKYYVWERCDDDEEGKPVWVNTITGKRTNVDPYW